MTADQYLQTHTSASKAVSHCGARKGVPLRRPGSPAPPPPALPSAGLGGLHAGIWVRTCLTHKPCKPQAALQTYMYARRRDVTHGQGRAAVAWRQRDREAQEPRGRWEAGGRQEGCVVSQGPARLLSDGGQHTFLRSFLSRAGSRGWSSVQCSPLKTFDQT